jgi:hypothetical protein
VPEEAATAQVVRAGVENASICYRSTLGAWIANHRYGLVRTLRGDGPETENRAAPLAYMLPPITSV